MRAAPAIEPALHGHAGARSALDIEGIATIGLEAWRKNYEWPVSDAEYEAIASAVWNGLLEISATLPEGAQDLLLSDIGMPGFLLQHLHIRAANSRLSKAGPPPLYGKIVESFLNPDWSTMARASGIGYRPESRLKATVRAGAKSWVLNDSAPFLPRAASVLGRAPVWALGSRTPMRAAYLAHHKTACRFVGCEMFAGEPKGNIGPELESALRRYIQLISAAAEKIIGADFDEEEAMSSWLARLSHLAMLADGVAAMRDVPRTLLLTGSGQPAHRIVARTLRRRGTAVVGFHHGNDMGALPYPTSDIVDLIPVDRFVAPSAACLRWRRDQYANGKVAALHTVEFERTAPRLYRDWLEQGSRAPLPKSVANVMIVGFPPNWIRYPHLVGHWALSQLEVEVALMECLATAGFKVLYKAHPEWEEQLRGVLADSPCEFIGGRLEECWTRADAMVFPRTSSTSFGFSLCTNRPILLLDFAEQTWTTEAYDMMSRRCAMIPAKIDPGLHIRFDEKALIDALRQPVREPDQTYVREAMCA